MASNAATMMMIILLSLFLCIRGEFRHFDGVIEAASNYIHYSEGYVITPGYVDISNLVFETVNNEGNKKIFVSKDENIDEPSDDEQNYDDGYDDGTVDAEDLGNDGGDRVMQNAGGSGFTFVDIVLFHEPSECANTKLGCDWTELGIGASDGVGNLRWCCSDDAPALGICTGGPKQEGRLIVDSSKFNGQHKFLPVPPSGEWHRKVQDGMFYLHNTAGASGKYVLVVANCNDVIGRNLTVSGQYTWSSVHGYLPGNLFGEMYFFFLTIGFYIILLVFYGCMMRVHRDQIIPIQKWVLATIFIGLLETFFKAGDLWVWNVDGERFWFTLYTGVIIRVLKRAISRCLVVMLCLGWGVTCDNLGSKFKKIVTLGIIYAGTSAVRDVMTVLAITENEVLSVNEETELLDVITILTFVVAFIDVTFYLWIFDALNGTMMHLESMNQSMKLKRYLRLRFILLISVLFAIVWSVFGIVNSYNDQRIVDEEKNGWLLSAVWEINYLLVLLGLSCLWVPEAGAKEYAYVMELSSLGGDLVFDTTIVDSPDDDNDDYDNDDDDIIVVSGTKGYSDIIEQDNLNVTRGVST